MFRGPALFSGLQTGNILAGRKIHAVTPSLQNQTQRVIGGVFPLEEPASTTQTNQDWSFLQQGVLHLASARGAFTLLVRTLRPRRVFGFRRTGSSSIVEAFREADTEVVFFPVGRDLRCESAVWLDRVAPGDFVLRIHYFGFPNSDPVFEEGALRGAWLVDDAAQALLSDGVGAGADFVVFSPRKFVGVPDGGCMIMRHPLPDLPPQFPPASTAWWRKSLSAVTLRREFDAAQLHDRAWFPTFQHAEGQVPIEPQSMSELSYRLLSRGINYTSIASRRRDNYKLLLEHIGEVAIFPELLQGGRAAWVFLSRSGRRDAYPRCAVQGTDISASPLAARRMRPCFCSRTVMLSYP